MTRKEAFQIARDYLIQNVGNMVGPSGAYYDERDKMWHITIVYQDALHEVEVGELQINSATSEVKAPSQAALLESLEKQSQQGVTILITVDRLDEVAIDALRQLKGVKSVQSFGIRKTE